MAFSKPALTTLITKGAQRTLKKIREANKQRQQSWEIDGPKLNSGPAFEVPLTSGASDKEPPAWLYRAGVSAWLVIGILIVISLAIYATTQLIPVFVAIFLALVLTSLLEPLTSWLSRFIPRGLATGLALLGLFGVFGALLTYVVSSVAGQWTTLANQFSTGVRTIVNYLQESPLHLRVSVSDAYFWFDQVSTQFQNYARTNATTVATEVLSNAGVAAISLTMLVLAIFVSVFLLWRGAPMWVWFLNRLPAHLRARTHRAAAAGWYTFSGYARGTIIVAFTDALMCFFLLLATGIPLAAPLSVLVFIGAFIPLVGAPTAMIIAMIVALAAKGVVAMVIVGVGIALIGQVEGHILQPLIMARQVSLHPVVVGVGVAAGTLLGGLLGAIVAIPIIAVIWAVYRELHDEDPPLCGDLPSVREVVSSRGEGNPDNVIGVEQCRLSQLDEESSDGFKQSPGSA